MDLTLIIIIQRVKSRPFGFFLVLWSTSARQFCGSLISRHIFQPIIAQLGNVDRRAVLLLIERYATVQGNTEKNKWGRFFFFYDWIDFEVL